MKLDSADKSATVSFAKDAVSKELGENRFRQLIKKVGEEKAMAMLEKGAALDAAPSFLIYCPRNRRWETTT